MGHCLSVLESVKKNSKIANFTYELNNVRIYSAFIYRIAPVLSLRSLMHEFDRFTPRKPRLLRRERGELYEIEKILTGLRSTAVRQNPRPLGQGVSNSGSSYFFLIRSSLPQRLIE